MRSLVVVALAVGLWAPEALAQKRSNEDRAKIHYDAGREHFEHGRYEAAATEFNAALALSPRPELRYNLYLAHERLGQFESALENLEAYLAQAKLDADEKKRLEARRDALRQRAAAARPAEPPAPEPEAEPEPSPPQELPPVIVNVKHERSRDGFIARLALGLGFANAETSAYRLSGGTGDLFLMAGWRVIPNLSLHAALWGGSMVGANIRQKGGLLPTLRDEETRYSAGALGLGASLHFPSQIYLSASLGAARVSAQLGNLTSESDVGGAVLVSAGKEWAIRGAWSAGLAVSASALSIPEEVDGREATSSVFMFAVLGTIAYD